MPENEKPPAMPVDIYLNGRHGNGVNDYIRDALDLVAFAKGAVNAQDENERYWANVRKSMGHPEPFQMQYLGIGNEQRGADYYNNYYEKFVEKFKEMSVSNAALYGGVELIAGNGPLFEHCENPAAGTAGEAKTAATEYKNSGKIAALSEYGTVDHRLHMGYVDFFANTHLYDSYSRDEDRYEVCVGGYSANNEEHPAGSFQHTDNSWITALSEAAFMTGLERNGDIVKMAAYAPAFGKYQTDETASMIFYTNTALMLTPNYYVQQLFMKNTGDYKVQSALTFSGDEIRTMIYFGQNYANAEVDSVYCVASADEETGDVIVKIVNSRPEEMKFNVAFGIEGLKMGSLADVCVLACGMPFETGVIEEFAVYPQSYTIGKFTDGKTLGYAAPAYSVTAIRIHTK